MAATLPSEGFVLTLPGSDEEQQLRLICTQTDHQNCYIVPFTFIQFCKDRRSLIKPVFVEDGKPMRVHVDQSIPKKDTMIQFREVDGEIQQSSPGEYNPKHTWESIFCSIQVRIVVHYGSNTSIS